MEGRGDRMNDWMGRGSEEGRGRERVDKMVLWIGRKGGRREGRGEEGREG